MFKVAGISWVDRGKTSSSAAKRLNSKTMLQRTSKRRKTKVERVPVERCKKGNVVNSGKRKGGKSKKVEVGNVWVLERGVATPDNRGLGCSPM